MDEGLPENIDRLFFSEDAPMRYEYRRLYRSMFKSPERYMDIVKALSENKSGLTLLDDIYDSGATLKEVGKLLTRKGAKYIVPMVIAKTVGGTL